MTATTTLVEFNDDYYARLIRLLYDPSDDAVKELIKIRDLTVRQYEINGWADEETLKKLHAPMPVREKRKKGGEGHSSSDQEPASRQSSIGEESLSPGGPRKEKDKLDKVPEASEVKDNVTVKRKAKAEPSTASSAEAEQPPVKKKAVKVFRDDPSIFGPLGPALSSSVVKKKTSSAEGLSSTKKVKKPKPKIIEQRLSKNTSLASSSSADPSIGKSSPRAVTADEVGTEFGLACVICNQISIERDNALVECQDCRRMYHQQCHNPPLAESEFTDPRVIWYCSSCSKLVKRSSSVKKTAEQSSSDESSNQGRSAGPDGSKSTKPVSTGIASLAADFLAKHKTKAIQPLASTSTIASKSTSGAVLPALKSSSAGIAKLAAAAKPFPKGVNSLSSERLQELAAERAAFGKKKPVTSPVGPSSNKDKLLAADKRLQLMKKKAEGKQRFPKL